MKRLLSTLILLTIVIKVGEFGIISPENFFRFDISILYCGMPNDTTFSIRTHSGKAAVNLYYPAGTKTFTVHEDCITVKECATREKIRLKVIKVTPEELTLEKL